MTAKRPSAIRLKPETLEKISGMEVQALWVDLKTYEQKIQYLVGFYERHRGCPSEPKSEAP